MLIAAQQIGPRKVNVGTCVTACDITGSGQLILLQFLEEKGFCDCLVSASKAKGSVIGLTAV